MPKESVTKALQKAIKGLLYFSESDAPFEVVYWPGKKEPLTPQLILKLTGKKAGTPVEVLSLDHFFGPLTEEEDWHEAEEKAQIKKYRDLQQTLEQQVEAPQVFKMGQVNIEIYLVGLTPEGDIGGVKTKAVET